MKLERITYSPGLLMDFFEDGLSTLGALCERTWHDRIELVAEGPAAKLWNAEGSIHAGELHFAASDTSTARDAAREVFPGCTLTFHLAEALRPSPLPLERLVLAGDSRSRPPDPGVAERLWRAQFPETTRWRQTTPFKPSHHFSLVALTRCEIQAIDQHWILLRTASALPGGELDDSLASDLGFGQADPNPTSELPWPKPDPENWRTILQSALELDLEDDLLEIRARQENSLRRELDRIDSYFSKYADEIKLRGARSSNETTKLKTADRLAATKSEHAKRRADQTARHEIRVRPHLDALLLVAEPAWQTILEIDRARRKEVVEAFFVPRSRRWNLKSANQAKLSD